MSAIDKVRRVQAAIARKALTAAPAEKVEEAEAILSESLMAMSAGGRMQAAWVEKLFPASIPVYYCPSLADLNKKPLLCGSCGGNLLAEHLRMVELFGVNLVPEGPGNTPGYGLRVTPLEPAAGLHCPQCGAFDKSSMLRSVNPIPKWLWVEDRPSNEPFPAAFALLAAIKGKDVTNLRSNSWRVAVGMKPKRR